MSNVKHKINIENWLALLHTPGVGPIKFRRCLEQDPDLKSLPRMARPDSRKVSKDLEWVCNNKTAYIIPYCDSRYPNMLKQIYNPPPVLYVLGDATLLNKPQLAIVGGRNATKLGLEIAYSFAQQFVKSGLIITSGLARGVDSAGHRGAIQKGKTIAVAAHGLHTVYPASNEDLAREILLHGCFVSEYSIGTQPLAARFIQRNRIISGLSLGVLVIDAGLPSGSLSTASYAREQNREVFAVPGAINNLKTRGCHMLIKHGAKLVESVEDVLEELANLFNCDIRDNNCVQGQHKKLSKCLNRAQKKLLNCIGEEPVNSDKLLAMLQLKSNELSASLVQLELEGLIKSVPGGYMKKKG